MHLSGNSMQNQGLGETEPDQAYKQGEGDEKDLAQVLFSLFCQRHLLISPAWSTQTISSIAKGNFESGSQPFVPIRMGFS